MDKIEECLAQEFEMTRMGKPSVFLGAELVYDHDGIWIHQRRYIMDLLERYGMENCNPLKVPMSTSANLKLDMNSKPADAHLFKSICGSLIYACNTRFDICFCCELYEQVCISSTGSTHDRSQEHIAVSEGDS